MTQLCLWTKIRTKQWLVLGASACQCMHAGFLCLKCDNFACLHSRQDQNELRLKRWFFFAKIGIFCKSILGPLLSVIQYVNILFFNFCEQKFDQRGLIAITTECNGLSLLIFKEKLPNYASGPKSALNSDSFWVRRLFQVCVRVFCASNATTLLVYIPAKTKMSFI